MTAGMLRRHDQAADAIVDEAEHEAAYEQINREIAGQVPAGRADLRTRRRRIVVAKDVKGCVASPLTDERVQHRHRRAE